MGFANDWRYTITGDSRHYCSLVHGHPLHGLKFLCGVPFLFTAIFILIF